MHMRQTFIVSLIVGAIAAALGFAFGNATRSTPDPIELGNAERRHSSEYDKAVLRQRLEEESAPDEVREPVQVLERVTDEAIVEQLARRLRGRQEISGGKGIIKGQTIDTDGNPIAGVTIVARGSKPGYVVRPDRNLPSWIEHPDNQVAGALHQGLQRSKWNLETHRVSTVSDAQGRFTLGRLFEDRSYQIAALKEPFEFGVAGKYGFQTWTLNARAGASVDLIGLRLYPLRVTFLGESGEPVTEAMGVKADGDKDESQVIRSGSVIYLRQGKYSISASSPPDALSTDTQKVIVGREGVGAVTLTVKRARVLRGMVIPPDGFSLPPELEIQWTAIGDAPEEQKSGVFDLSWTGVNSGFEIFDVPNTPLSLTLRGRARGIPKESHYTIDRTRVESDDVDSFFRWKISRPDPSQYQVVSLTGVPPHLLFNVRWRFYQRLLTDYRPDAMEFSKATPTDVPRFVERGTRFWFQLSDKVKAEEPVMGKESAVEGNYVAAEVEGYGATVPHRIENFSGQIATLSIQKPSRINFSWSNGPEDTPLYLRLHHKDAKFSTYKGYGKGGPASFSGVSGEFTLSEFQPGTYSFEIRVARHEYGADPLYDPLLTTQDVILNPDASTTVAMRVPDVHHFNLGSRHHVEIQALDGAGQIKWKVLQRRSENYKAKLMLPTGDYRLRALKNYQLEELFTKDVYVDRDMSYVLE